MPYSIRLLVAHAISQYATSHKDYNDANKWRQCNVVVLIAGYLNFAYICHLFFGHISKPSKQAEDDTYG